MENAKSKKNATLTIDEILQAAYEQGYLGEVQEDDVFEYTTAKGKELRRVTFKEKNENR